jgi:predicted Zn-dependent peptidase
LALAWALLPLWVRAEKLPVQEIRLDNGLRILVLERSFSPTFAAYYRFGVGGAVDPKGLSGLAHMLEHMMFKGTRQVGTLDPEEEARLLAREDELWGELSRLLDHQDDPLQPPDPARIRRLSAELEQLAERHKRLVVKNEFDEILSRAGAIDLNATTGSDSTDYYLQLPSNHLELWFWLESDRLLNPVFREFYSERDVVAEERRMRIDNRPPGVASETLDRLVFRAHPYGTPVIGWPSDIARLSRADALAFFRTYYSPSNCVMVLVGDVRASEVERLARKYFGSWKRQEIPPLRLTAEPPPRGPTRQILELEAEPGLRMGWLGVPLGHPDHYALEILGSILGGMNSSRLDQELVHGRRLATSVYAYNASLQYAGSFEAGGRPVPGHTLEELEQAIWEQILRLQKDGITDEELARAKTSVEVNRVKRLSSNLWLASELAWAAGLAGRWQYMEEYEARLEAVTAEEVRQAAGKYLLPSRANVVMVRRPEGSSGQALPEEETGPAHSHGSSGEERGARHSPGFARALQRIEKAPPVTLKVPQVGKDVDRVELPGGITVYIKEDHSAPSISLALWWTGGYNTTPVEQLAPAMLADLLLNQGGTEALTPGQVEEAKDRLGLEFSLSLGATYSEATFWSLAGRFEESWALATDILMRPRLDPARLEVLKARYLESMRRRPEDPDRAVDIALRQVLYQDHPRLSYVPPKDQLLAVRPEDVRAVLERYLGRQNLTIVAVGDFDKQKMLATFQESLGNWRLARQPQREWITRPPQVRPGLYYVEKDFPQPAVRIVQEIPVDRSYPEKEHAALEILDQILGGSGFRSRLVERLRSDEGLTYDVSSAIWHEGRPGVPGRVTIGYQTRTQTVARSIASALDEYRKIREHPVSEAELAEQKQAWRNRFIFNFTREYDAVYGLAANAFDDRPYDWDRRRLESIQQVTAQDVQEVARKYLDPSKVTIVVYGQMTPQDLAALKEQFPVTLLTDEQVFKGGY